jgi:hypothetical protein
MNKLVMFHPDGMFGIWEGGQHLRVWDAYEDFKAGDPASDTLEVGPFDNPHDIMARFNNHADYVSAF